MKTNLYILIFLVAGLFSCGDDEALPLTPELVSEIHAYDLDNNGNSSDIRVDFEIKDNLNVIEYRIMIVPSSASTSFDEGSAASIPSTSYFEIEPEVFKNEHSIKRLPSSLLDVNGSPIQNDGEYVAAVFVIGEDDKQLSQPFSLPFVLTDLGVFSGNYVVASDGWGQDYCGRGVRLWRDASFLQIASVDGKTYSGTLLFVGDVVPPLVYNIGDVIILLGEEKTICTNWSSL